MDCRNSAVTGVRGEEAAVAWLRRNGYEICSRNWRNGIYEIDIVAKKNYVIHFVEVKTRSVLGFVSPEDTIIPSKKKAIKRASQIYLSYYKIDLEFEFDLVGVDLYPDDTIEVRFIPNAIEYNW